MDRQLADIRTLEARHAEAIRVVRCGKRVGNSIYLHQELLARQPPVVGGLAAEAARLAELPSTAFNVVRLSTRRPEVALLHYPNFFTEPFPALKASWLVRLSTTQTTHSDFSRQENPPILHRKELLLPKEHPDYSRFARLTAALDACQAFSIAPHLIGKRTFWNEALSSLGIRVDGDEIVRTIDSDADVSKAQILVARHRTAISRSRLSAPMQSLARWGFLDGSFSVLDYGCGRGDDVSALAAAGINVSGWDPHFAPESPLVQSEVVNLGFVLNVIESASERADALTSAFQLARRVLSVGVMLHRNNAGEIHADGILTRRQTFQHYYTQAELHEYVARVLGRDPITIAPGVVFLFRTDDDEQAFLVRKQRSPASVEGFSVPQALQHQAIRTSLYARHQLLLDQLWSRSLELGRLPFADELNQGAELIAAFGSPRRAFAALPFPDKEVELECAAAFRRDDLLVYLALNIFERRASFGLVPDPVQRDVKAFFGSYKSAIEQGNKALFETGNAERIRAAAIAANSANLGVLDTDDGDYMFLASSLARQPTSVRIILGCAERVEPQPADIDLIKVHGSGQKVSYLSFDNFAERALPTLVHRTIVDLARQRSITVLPRFADGPRVLLGKSRFMLDNSPGRDRQASFDDVLRKRGILTTAGLGPGYRVLARRLTEVGLISTRLQSPPADRMQALRDD